MVDRLPSKTNEEVSDTLKGGLELKPYLIFFIYQKSQQQEYVENVKTKDGDIIVLYKVTPCLRNFEFLVKNNIFEYFLYLYIQDQISGQITKKIVLTQEDYDQLLILVTSYLALISRTKNKFHFFPTRWGRPQRRRQSLTSWMEMLTPRRQYDLSIQRVLVITIGQLRKFNFIEN